MLHRDAGDTQRRWVFLARIGGEHLTLLATHFLPVPLSA
jgi:hypothetical protein